MVSFAHILLGNYQIGGKCNRGVYAKHPSACAQYLQCVQGRFEARSCPPGLHWNDEEECCDWPGQTVCFHYGSPTPQEDNFASATGLAPNGFRSMYIERQE